MMVSGSSAASAIRRSTRGRSIISDSRPCSGRLSSSERGRSRRMRAIAQPIDIIVSDIQIPAMTGIDLLRIVRAYDLDVPVKTLGLPQEFLAHGTRQEVLDEAGLTSQQVALRITEAVARRSSASAVPMPGPGPDGEAVDAREAAPEGRPVE